MKIIKVAQAIDGAVFLDKEECVAYDRMVAAVVDFNEKYGEKYNNRPVRLYMNQSWGNTSLLEMKPFKPYELKQ